MWHNFSPSRSVTLHYAVQLNIVSQGCTYTGIGIGIGAYTNDI